MAEGEQSIFEAFARAEESSGGVNSRGGGGTILNQIEKVDWTIAKPAIQAFKDIQDQVVRMALSNVVLGKYLVEVVCTIEELIKQTRSTSNDEAGQEVEMKVEDS